MLNKYLGLLEARMLGDTLCNQMTFIPLKGAISTILLLSIVIAHYGE